MKKFLLSLVSLFMLTVASWAGEPSKVLTFPDHNDKSISSYTSEWTATVDGDVWTLYAFNNNQNKWAYVKCGWATDATTATITSPAVGVAITDIVITVDATKNVESATLTVFNDATVVNEPIDITADFVAGDVHVAIPEPAAGYSYKLTVQSPKVSKSGTTQISKVALYEAGQYEAVEPVHIANTAETAYTVAEAYNLIDAGEALSDVVYVKGIISQVESYNDQFKSISYWISDDGTTEKQLECYSGKGLNGADFTSVDDVKVGAVVIVKGNLKKYNTTYELDKNNELVSYDFSYLTNPSFEYAAQGVAATAQGLTNGGEFYGWTLPKFDADYVNISIGSATECAGNGAGVPTPKDGNFYYFARHGWNTSNTSDGTLSTTMKALPVGNYTLSFAYKAMDAHDNDNNKGADSYLTLIAKSGEQELASYKTPAFVKIIHPDYANYFKGDANWLEAKMNFNVKEAGDVELDIVHHFRGIRRSDVVIDDVRLEYNGDIVSTYTVTVAEGIENGTVVAAPAEAFEGDVITLTVTPDEGYVLETLTVMNGEEVIEVSENNTFVMPAGDVTVTATFKEESPKNVTNLYLVNADLNSMEGWTRGGAIPGTHDTNLDVNAIEYYNAWSANPGTPIGSSKDFSLTQTVTLPAGDYRIVVNAFYREGNGNGTNTKAYIFAGEKKQYVHAITPAEQNNIANGSGIYGNSKVNSDMGRAAYAFSIGDFENAFDFSVEQDNSEVELGFKGYIDTYCSWCILGPVKLYKYSLEDYLAAYREKVAEAEALYESKMGAAELQALQAAVVDETAFTTGAQVTAALDVLNAALAAAKISVAGYATLTNALTLGETYKANSTNAEAIAAYDAAIAEVKAAYDAATVEDLDAAVAIVNAALPALARTQTADNSDLTVLINNPEVNGADGWTDERPNGGNGPLLGNTAFEYWAGNATSRETACFDYYQVIEGLVPGIYTLSAEMYNSLNGEDGVEEFVPTCGVYAAAEGVEVSKLVDVDGTELIRYTTDGITVTNGTLRIGVKNVVTPMVARWFVADNFKLTLVKNIEADLAYEAANEAMVSGKDYFVSSVMGDNTYYLKKDGYLTANKAEAGIFNIVSRPGNAETYKELGWQIPEFTNGGDNKNEFTGASKTHLIPGNQHRADFETQVLYLNKEGKYAIRSTNSTSASWGAAAFWTVVEDNDADGLPNATYVMNEMPYIWNIEPIESDARCVAYQKTQEWPAKLVAAWTSNAKDPSEGSYEALTDRDYATFFHSSWRTTAPDEDHYLQAELPEAKNDLIFYFKKRSTNNNNRPTAITISASKDGENFTDITSITEGLPTDANVIDYTSTKIDLGDSYNFLRFTVTATNTGATANGHVFFTFSEFYIMNGELENYWNISDWTALTDEDIANINALDEQINAAQQAWLDREEVFAIKMKAAGIYERIQAYAAGVPGEFEAKMALYAALDGVDVDSPTTVEGANAVVQQLNEIAANFVVALSDVEDRDVTGAFLDNSTPTSDAEGWTIENGPATFDAGNDVAEFWNKSAASIKQTVFLPAGNYKLAAQAVTRSEMVAQLMAGENQTEIVTMPSSGSQFGVDALNSRAHVNAWFTAGNGWNEVEFTLDEPANVEVGLLADNATGDHWMVWRSFVITKIGTHIDPNDMTSLIVNPAYLGVEGNEDLYAGWNHTENGWKARSYEAPMNLITYSGNCEFEVNQTIENVPAGLYRLSVHAFYRAGSLEDEQAKVAAGTELEKELVMYANVNDADNKYSKKVMNLSEGAADAQVEGTGVEFAEGQYVPNSAADARTWYIAGEYKNEVLFNVFEDGSVTIGLSKAVGLAGDYCPVGAWSLYRVGDADETEATPDPKPAVPASVALATVTYDGQEVVFNEENVASIDGAYDAAKELVVVAEAGEAVSVEVSYPTEIGQDQIVITVADKDVENFPENKATYTIVFSVPTAIDFIKADEKTVIYDVTGRRVSKAVKGGLYIINGKKTMVK
ncbi:MAG: discoidin domain-containing protein [Bacteroidaceae bacterium]|nr:discoidin domain-containing protein [Bacteroidaceae bacterium]